MATESYTRIKGLSDIRRLPRLGKIRLGIKKVSAKGKEYPSEVDYFVVPPEVAKVYGDRPTALDVMLPTEDDHMVFPQSYKWYVANGLRCKGDGETAQRRFADLAQGDRVPIENGTATHEPNDYVRVACPCPLLESGECRENANLMVLLPKVSLGGVYQITTGSFHNIVRINSCIDYVRAVVGHTSLVPLVLTRQQEELQYEGKKAKHYLLQLILSVNLEDAAKLRENARMILASTSRLVLPAPVEDGLEPTGPAPIEVESAPVEATQEQTEKHTKEPSLIADWIAAIEGATSSEQLESIWSKLTIKGTGLWWKIKAKDQSELLTTKGKIAIKLKNA